MTKPKVYLAGQWNEYENDWKEEIKQVDGFEFFDPEFNADQTNPEKFYKDDLSAIKQADILIANPGLAPSEATWIEIGYFLALNTKQPGEKCNQLIIIWKPDRQPQWSIEFLKQVGIIVDSVEGAVKKLKRI